MNSIAKVQLACYGIRNTKYQIIFSFSTQRISAEYLSSKYLPPTHSKLKLTKESFLSFQSLPPFKSISLSIPFLAMVILHFGNMWGLYFIMTAGPKFVSSVLGFELSSAGAISALPYLARLSLATVFGVIGDIILARKIMTTVVIRKFFTLFSHIIPGILLVFLVYAGCSTILSVALITMSMGFNGAATLTNLQNHQDLAPTYAGTLYGIANCIGSTAGFFTPMITAYFTRNGVRLLYIGNCLIDIWWNVYS